MAAGSHLATCRVAALTLDDRYQTPQELQDAVEGIAAGLAAEFGTVPERIVAKPEPEKKESRGSGPLQVEPPATAEPLLLTTLASPLFDSYLGVEVGAMVGGRYRLVREEREGNGGRLFLAQDEKASSRQSAEVGLKLLHPAITADPALLDLLENEIGVIRQASHSNLVRYFRLERSPPFLVREWIHGFLLYDLLRWRRSLSAAELEILLGPLAATLDFVAERGLGLVDASVRKILMACPKETAREDFPNLARGEGQDWRRCTLKLNPLSLAPFLFRSRNGWDRQTVVPTSRVLSMTQAEAGIRGSKAVRLYGRLVYELLSGHAPVRRGEPQKYTPLPELDQAGNETLRRACATTGSGEAYRSCQEFWNALKENIVAAVRPTGVPLSRPATPTPSALPPPPPPPKRRLMIGAIVAGAFIIALAIFIAIRFGGSGMNSVVTPIPSVANVTPTPTPVVLATPPPSVAIASPTPAPTASSSPVVVATPTPTPTIPSKTVETTKEEPADKTFDGVWSVTLNMHDYKDPGTGAVAQGFVRYFAARVKNGVLHGEHGTRGTPGWLEINGKIEADGTAILHASGIKGSETYNMPSDGASHGRSGAPYDYDISAQFKGGRGTGKRIGPRIGIFDFVKN